MRAFPTAQIVGALILLVGVAGSSTTAVASRTAPDKVAVMVDQIFADVPAAEPRVIVLRDDREGAYLAFYVSTYAEVREVRAYSVTYRNITDFVDEKEAIDKLIDAGNYAEAFDTLLGLMRLDMGSRYVSDVGVDGIHEGEVAVGEGRMRDRFHTQVFADHAAANEAYMHWLERAIELAAT